MDPNEALRLLRLTIKQWRAEGHSYVRNEHASSIVEYFEALDEWLSRDGFLPDDWRSDDEKAEAYDPHGGEKHRYYEEN